MNRVSSEARELSRSFPCHTSYCMNGALASVIGCGTPVCSERK